MSVSKLISSALVVALTCGASAQTGTPFCSASPNSTGASASLVGYFGSGVGSGLHLEVTTGVPNEIGYFLAGNESTSGVIVSDGLNCLIGTGTAQMFRYNVTGSNASSIGRFDTSGVLQNLAGTSLVGSGFDVPSTIPAGVPIPIMSGDTWHFQLWHRDTGAAPGHSNFSNGLSVVFQFSPQPIPGMVPIPSGTFAMGSNAQSGPPYFGDSTTQPVHDVTISQSFWMGEHEVTQAEYLAVIGTNPSFRVGSTQPVENVTWNNATLYCETLTELEIALGHIPAGYEYRLPTEAEWEYACRAGTTTEFSTGAELLCSEAQIDFSHHSNADCNANRSVPVGSFLPNAWGLYDMHGNVFEWCLDSYSPYSPGHVTDPVGTSGSDKVIRGGSWVHNSSISRSALRGYFAPEWGFWNFGFRVVLVQISSP